MTFARKTLPLDLPSPDYSACLRASAQNNIIHFSDSDIKKASTFPTIPLSELQIIKKVGSGAFGNVLKAHYVTPLGKIVVAMKVFGDGEDPLGFPNERVALAKINDVGSVTHPNIIPLYGFGVSSEARAEFIKPNNPYIVTKFMSRGSLSHFIKEEGILSWNTILNIAYAIADGVAYLHKKSVVHKDLKLANILVDKTLNVTINDFGTANAVGCIGTPYAMPPEAGGPPNSAMDVYSFGIILLELLDSHFYEKFTHDQPYIHLQNPSVKAIKIAEAIEAAIATRKDFSPTQSSSMKTILSECLAMNYLARPTMLEVMQKLASLKSPHEEKTEIVTTSNYLLDKVLTREDLKWNEIIKIAAGIISDLHDLHQRDLIHDAVDGSHILVDKDKQATLVNPCPPLANHYSADAILKMKSKDIYTFGILLLRLLDEDSFDKNIPPDRLDPEIFIDAQVKSALNEADIPKDCSVNQFTKIKELIERCIDNNPKKRFTAEQAKQCLDTLLALQNSLTKSSTVFATKLNANRKNDYLVIHASKRQLGLFPSLSNYQKLRAEEHPKVIHRSPR